ncbi:MAG TPA: hypothetical protein VF765_08360 [Polyangiaceae bacterium]
MLASLALGAQCTGDPSVTFEVVLPGSLASNAQWMEIGVFPGGCPGATEIAGGLPATGPVDRIAVEKGNTTPPPIGTLKKGSYGFVAVARASNCGVIGTGCSNVDVTNSRDVSISVTATSPPLGACSAEQSCVDARCIASATPDASGAACALSLVGAGPLGDPYAVVSDVVSAPAVVATERGFLIAYREYDDTGGTAQLTLATVDPGGALSIPMPTMLVGQCPMQDESDGIGMAYVTGAGVVASARPACGSQSSGIDLLAVDAAGHSSSNMFSPLTGPPPALSYAHALSLAGMTTGWLAYLAGGNASVIALSNLQLQGPSTTIATAPQSIAQVSATGQAVALLTGGAGGGADAGTSTPLLSLGIGGTPGDGGGAPTVFGGSWGALAAAGTRAFVLSDSGTSTQPVAWHTLDQGGTPASGNFATPAMGTALGGDVALQGDRALFAVEQKGAISLVAFDHASTAPTLLRSVQLSGDARIPPQATVRDGKVAVAASANEVLVAWVTGTNLTANEAVGGWALYACSP